MKLVYLCTLFIAIVFAQSSGPTSIRPNNGVHSGRVFRFRPEIQWFYNASSVGAEGWLSLDNKERTLFYPNMNIMANIPNIFQFSFDGELIANWTTGRLTGFVEQRDGVLYVWDDSQTLTAVNLTNGQDIWTTVFPTAIGAWRTITPLLWSPDASTFYIMNAATIGAVRVSDGTILWNISRPAAVSQSVAQYMIPLVHSEIDNTFVVQWSTATVAKYNYTTGEELWTYQFTTSNIESASPAPVVDSNGNIFAVCSDGQMVGLDKNGVELWTTTKPDSYYFSLSPAMMNDSYSFVTDDSIGDITTVDTRTGVLTTSYEVGGTELVNMGASANLLWNNNVLYVCYFKAIAAFDTTDPLNLQLLWALNPNFNAITGAGLAVADDGTMFLADAYVGGLSPVLVSIGCPGGKIVNPAGTECVCRAGTVLNQTSEKCEKCPAGTFSNENDATCTSCTEQPSNEQCILPPTAGTPNAPQSAAPTSTNVPQNGSAPKGKTSAGSKLTFFFVGLIAGALTIL